MVISGIYVEAIPGQASYVAEKLALLEGVEIHHIHEDYRIILTLETITVDESYKTGERMKEIKGLVNICLVYTNFEDEPFYQESEAAGVS